MSSPEIAVEQSELYEPANPLFVTLLKRVWIIIPCLLLGIGLGVVLIVTAEKKFASHGKMLVYQKLPTFMDESTRLPDPKAYDSLFATHLQLIKSDLIVSTAVEDYKLAELEVLDSMHAEHRAIGKKTLSSLIRDHLKISRAGSGDSAGAFVIAIEFEHKSASECPVVVDAIMETYRSYLNNSMLQDQGRALQLLTDVRHRIEGELATKASSYREFLTKAPDVWDRDTQTNSHQKRVDKFKEELTVLELKKAALESRIEILGRKKNKLTGKPLTDLERLALVDEMHLPRLEVLLRVKGEKIQDMFEDKYPELQEVANAKFNELLAMQVERTNLEGYLGADHPRIRDLNRDIKILENRLKSQKKEIESVESREKLTPQELVRAYENFLIEDLRDVNERISFVSDSIDREIKSSKQLYDFSIQAQYLKDDYDNTRRVAESLVDKVEKQALLGQFGSFVAAIVERPIKGQLIWPKKSVVLVLCAIVGIFVGTFLALAMDLFSRYPPRKTAWRAGVEA